MKNSDVTEGNKLISDYINKKLENEPDRFFTLRYDQYTPFHKDWNLLMPVYIILKDVQADDADIIHLKMMMKAALMEGEILLLHSAIVRVINFIN